MPPAALASTSPRCPLAAPRNPFSQRRPIWHRMGKRTIVVADVPYVHQILETYVSKMYALSFGIASVGERRLTLVAALSCQDWVRR